jgi:low temperature requirement protein LtrA
MGGRDPRQEHRVATPLELLFDLTFASCFGLAASQFAHTLAAGHPGAAVLGFGYATFAICWAWINFSWFSSAYDTDDWIFRIVTMVQMIGVLILATGLPRMFASVTRGEHIDNSVMVLGYVIMRLALVSLWLRAAVQDPARRRACLTYATAVAVAQVGWVALLAFGLSTGMTLVLSGVLLLIELWGPILGEREDGGTPWHAHHVSERHALFATIALGEGIVGTVAALSAVVAQKGWTTDAALVCAAGTALTFGMWWIYYLLPSAQILDTHRNRAFIWGLCQIAIVTSIVATGAGLQVAASFITHDSQVSLLATTLSVALPVGVLLVVTYLLYYYLVRRWGRFDAGLLIASTSVVIATIAAAGRGLDLAWCLLALALAPAVTVIGFETLGYRRDATPNGA